MSDVAELIERLKISAQATESFNRSHGRKGTEWAKETEIEWKAAEALSFLDHATSAMSSELFRITTDNERATAALRAAESKLAKAMEALEAIGDVHRELPLIDALASDLLTGRILKCREIADAVLTEIKGGE